jgi:hypothetical protein
VIGSFTPRTKGNICSPLAWMYILNIWLDADMSAVDDFILFGQSWSKVLFYNLIFHEFLDLCICIWLKDPWGLLSSLVISF